MTAAHRVLVATALSGLALLAPLATAGAAPAATGSAEPSERYLVRYDAGTDVAAQAGALRGQGVNVRRTFSRAVRAAAVTATPAQAATLARHPNVESVELDGLVRASDTQSPAPWGLDRVDQRALPLSGTFTAPSSGAGVDVYVIDTGVRSTHSDLAGRVKSGFTAINDGRGTSDCNGHGTHVAGTAAGTTYGVAKAANVIPVRVLGCDGSGRMSDVLAGLDWVAAQHAAGTPAVANLSLGSSASSTVDAALSAVVDDGVTAAVAAGNSATDACTVSPARVPAALTVAASDASDRQASFSNHGTCVDLYAPGASITSAYHTSTTATAVLSGTSMASPHAAGAAAVVLGQNRSLTPAQVLTVLLEGATTKVISDATVGTANRLLFVPTVATGPVSAPVSAPSSPSNVVATAGKRSATVSWTRGSDGGSALTGQTVHVYSGTTRVGSVPVSATVTRVTVSGLTGGRSYAFTVVATNAVGSSPESARSNTVTVRR